MWIDVYKSCVQQVPDDVNNVLYSSIFSATLTRFCDIAFIPQDMYYTQIIFLEHIQARFLYDNVKLNLASKVWFIYDPVVQKVKIGDALWWALKTLWTSYCSFCLDWCCLFINYHVSWLRCFHQDMRSILGTCQGRFGQKVGQESRGVLPRWTCISNVKPSFSK